MALFKTIRSLVTHSTPQERLLALLLLALTPAASHLLTPLTTLHAQSNGVVNALYGTDISEVPAGSGDVKLTIFGYFPVADPQPQASICFYTGSGTTQALALIPPISTSQITVIVPASTFHAISPSSFSGDTLYSTIYATANSTDTCNGSFDNAYTQYLSFPIQLPSVTGADLSLLTQTNPNLVNQPPPHVIYLSGNDFVPGNATVTADPYGAVAVAPAASTSTSLRVNLPTGVGTDTTFTVCNDTVFCSNSNVTVPTQGIYQPDGNLIGTTNAPTTTTPVTLTATFGDPDAGEGAYSGPVTFRDTTSSLSHSPFATAPAVLTVGKFAGKPQTDIREFGNLQNGLVADLNNDGLKDVVIVSNTGVQVIFGSSSQGLFNQYPAGVDFPIDDDYCSSPISGTIGDFNGDGYPDIALLCNSPSTSDPSGPDGGNILIYTNQGDGTFTDQADGAANVIVSSAAAQIIAADVDKDGKLDLVTAGWDGNKDPDSGAPENGLNVFLSTGPGTFATTSGPIPSPQANAVQIAAADFNNDGFPDIAILRRDVADPPTTAVEVYQNDGKGGFSGTPTYEHFFGDNFSTFQFFVENLPGNPWPNLVAISGGSDPGIAVVQNNQTPTVSFSDPGATVSIPNIQAAAIGDFTGDGLPDIVTFDGTQLQVFPGDKSGLFSVPFDSFTTADLPLYYLIGASDPNSDGYDDPIAIVPSLRGGTAIQQFLTSGSVTATLAGQTFTAGHHTIDALHPGNATQNATDPTFDLDSTSILVAPTLRIVMSPADNPATYTGANVSFGADVSTTSSPTAPTGTIQFFDNGKLLGTQTLTANGPADSGASLLHTFSTGTHPLTFVYSGDGNYSSGTSGIFNYVVNQATTGFTYAPNPNTITYPAALSAAQLDATANTTGTTVYTDAGGKVVSTSTILPVGVNPITATFTPDDTFDYITPSPQTQNIIVNKGNSTVDLVIAPTTPTSYDPAVKQTLTATVTTVQGPTPTGVVQFVDTTTTTNFGNVTLTPTGTNTATASIQVGPLAAGLHRLVATYGGDATYALTSGNLTDYTVQPSTPVITWNPSPSSIIYGTAVVAGQLNATAAVNGSSVPGAFAYTFARNPVSVGTVLPPGSDTLTVTFTPTDTVNYATASGNAIINVTQATPIITWSNPADIAYGTPLSATQLNATANFGGNPVDGTFLYNPTPGTVLTAGPHTLNVTFTPTDTTTYTTAIGSVTLNVTQATPIVQWPTNPPITYGTPLSSAQLNAVAKSSGNTVPGTYVYTPAAGKVLDAGLQTLNVTFTPTDTANFTTATGSTTLPVRQATPVITWSNPADIAYGTALSATQLNATASFGGNPVAGAFVYDPVAGTVLNAGSHTLSVTFTPTDTTNFTANTASVSINVTQSTPIIQWPTLAPIPYGTALSATQLNAVAKFNGNAVPGTYSYTPAAGTVLAAGTQTLNVTFTPTDTADYNTATGSTTLIVTQATPAITWPTPAAIPYGTALSATQLNATATFNGNSVEGVFTYNPTAGSVLTAGPHTLGVTFTPMDTTNFTAASGSTTISVSQATPTITWPTPAAIPYGTALSATQLDATATFNGNPVPGVFSYTPAAGTVLTAGPHTLNVTFTPTDTTNFTAATGSTTISVSQATPTITWANPASIPYGAALTGTQLNATATFNGNPVPGSFVYNPAAGTVLNAGSHPLTVTFTPADTTNFSAATGSATLTVTQAVPILSWTPPAPISYGTALSSTQLNATASYNGNPVAGSFVYNPAAGTVLNAGVQSLNATFTPTDAVNFTTAALMVPLTVNPAATTTTVFSSVNPSQFGQGTNLTFNVASPAGIPSTGTISIYDGSTLIGTVPSFTANLNIATLSAGTHNLTAVYAGNANFATSTSPVLTQTVSAATTTIAWTQPASIPYGTKLSATQLNASVSTAFSPDVQGTFAYTPAAGALLTAGPHTLNVTFTPTDTASYKTATGSVTITVTKVAPTLSWTAPAAITAGIPLSATQLNATAIGVDNATLPGVFTYTPAAGAILAPGVTTLNVSFAPTDAVDYNTASTSVPLTVNPAIATAAVTSSANPSEYGQPVTLSISLTSAYTGAAINGPATVTDGATVLGTPTLVNGAATLVTSALAACTHNIVASFAGDSNFAAATSPALTQTVNKGVTTVSWATPAAITYGAAISATQQTAKVSTPFFPTVPGAFTYKEPIGTVLSAGTQTLTVTFTPTDAANFASATGTVALVVGKATPTLAWATPDDIVFGTKLSATQLNATATGIAGALPGTFVYTPAAGSTPAVGANTLSVTFTPTDAANYATATATVPLNVIAVGLISLSSNTALLGDPDKTITLTGAGFLSDSVVMVNNVPVATTFVNRTTLTAVIPAANFTTVRTLSVVVNDPTQSQTTNALTIAVTAPPVTIVLSGPGTVSTADQPSLTFKLPNPYPVPITGTFTLTFTPSAGLPNDQTVLFPNGQTTESFTIPANTTVTPPVVLQSGSVAGTITVTLTLTAGGQTIIPTPAVPPVVIIDPTSTPGITGAKLTRSGNNLTVAVLGFSNIRQIDHVLFHFVPAPGHTLATSDVTISGTDLFIPYFQDPASLSVGSAFEYDQIFNLSEDASAVGQVQVTLYNSLGASETETAQ